ncbi:hypothetical protein HZI73_21710 [Vallitalea pronyensis]|uniref:Uncharacterized protein n=1 Tax=Vallitalea pronyensis TaxID=1348613 RepID=A0A8J8MNL8_9FIRM|nr:hypothetical protein [Vallitalea pronyensis]QUI24756.1 hypothetical protein HZI73_21710 [Vallitalea pronyensis]
MFYNMILWAHAQKEEFKHTIDKAYGLLNILAAFDQQFIPRYIPAKSKKLAKEFDGTRDHLIRLLEKGVNQENGIIFEDLGRRISFFTSKITKESAYISMMVGVSNEDFINSLVVRFPQCINFTKAFNVKVEEMFKACCMSFKPYWGCISNTETVKKYDYKHWNNGLPTSVHWMNYFDETLKQKLPMYKLHEMDIYLDNLEKGCVLRIKDAPIDSKLEYDRKRLTDINKLLQLE